ncbi:MAG TPA: hypothetical protein VFQ61_34835 [Polyangiaceae bacterium]|nr:hypothetical protein [Polyangiaceae bacterium]
MASSITSLSHSASVGARRPGVTWMALVAATTLGITGVSRLRAEVSGPAGELSRRREYRLVVQSYPARNVVNGVPLAHARPLASAQRTVTAEQIAEGVAVDVLDMGEAQADSERVIVAWVEPGAADLEMDGHRARPSRGAYVGVADAAPEQARVVLNRKVG